MTLYHCSHVLQGTPHQEAQPFFICLFFSLRLCRSSQSWCILLHHFFISVQTAECTFILWHDVIADLDHEISFSSNYFRILMRWLKAGFSCCRISAHWTMWRFPVWRPWQSNRQTGFMMPRLLINWRHSATCFLEPVRPSSFSCWTLRTCFPWTPVHSLPL